VAEPPGLVLSVTVFPADDAVRTFLRSENRGDDFTELIADEDATYDVTDEIDLSVLEPLIAKPSSPGNVVAVREVAGQEVSQVVIGSSANPGLRDYAIVAAMLKASVPEPRPHRQRRRPVSTSPSRPVGNTLPRPCRRCPPATARVSGQRISGSRGARYPLL
jgi:aconitase A